MARRFVMTRTSFRVCGIVHLLVAVALSSPLGADGGSPAVGVPISIAPDAPPLERWIEELGSPRYKVREEATEALFKAGALALDLLRSAADGQDPEVADRAVWILQRLTHSDDQATEVAALETLTHLKGVLRLRLAARGRLAEVREQISQYAIERQGGRFLVRRQVRSEQGVVTSVEISLDDQWRGNAEDLSTLGHLGHVTEMKLRGRGVDDVVLAALGTMPQLDSVVLYNSRATPEAIAQLKSLCSNVRIRLQNQAKLGINYVVAEAGVGIESVEEESAAAHAGLMPGDVIFAFNGVPVHSFDLLMAHIGQYQPGAEVRLSVRRDDRPMLVTATLGRW